MTGSTDVITDDEKRMGRRPEGPAHPRKGGLVQTVKRTVTEFQEDNLTDWAAALTYYSVLSIFPALIALVSIVGLVGDPKTVTDSLTDVVSAIGPSSAVDTFKGPIEDVTQEQRHGRPPRDRGHRRGAVDGLRLRRAPSCARRT